MIGGTRLAKALKDEYPSAKVCFVGSHSSALPREDLAHPHIDIVPLNEGVYTRHNLLASDLGGDLKTIRGIGYKAEDGAGRIHAVLNPPERVVPQERMEIDLPGMAWDVPPYRDKPLDLYARISGTLVSTTASAPRSRRWTLRSAAISPAISA
jgi:anaerobic magnesium-protoporphyrin IX monomethyl ester cyclase